MATQTLSAQTGANNASYGSYAWSNASNIVSINSSYATTANPSSNTDKSNYLRASNFGFTIPAGSTIDGITVSIVRKASSDNSTNYAIDDRVRLVNGSGVVESTDYADVVTKWATTDTTIDYGGASDLWGDTWTPSDVNDSDFGVALSVLSYDDNSGPGATASVDNVTITIDYTPPVVTFIPKATFFL